VGKSFELPAEKRASIVALSSSPLTILSICQFWMLLLVGKMTIRIGAQAMSVRQPRLLAQLFIVMERYQYSSSVCDQASHCGYLALHFPQQSNARTPSLCCCAKSPR